MRDNFQCSRELQVYHTAYFPFTFLNLYTSWVWISCTNKRPDIFYTQTTSEPDKRISRCLDSSCNATYQIKQASVEALFKPCVSLKVWEVSRSNLVPWPTEMRVFVFFLIPYMQTPAQCHQTGYDSFLPHHLQFTIYRSSYHSTAYNIGN